MPSPSVLATEVVANFEQSEQFALCDLRSARSSMSDSGSDGDGLSDERLERFQAFVEKFEIDLDDPVESVNDLESLEELDLSDKGFTELPDDLLDAVPPNLCTLALEKNKLSALPDGIAAFSQITELYLRENTLTALPPAIGALTKLESLYLEDNQITTGGIPAEIAQLATSLVGLCLHRNTLTVSTTPHCVRVPRVCCSQSLTSVLVCVWYRLLELTGDSVSANAARRALSQ